MLKKAFSTVACMGKDYKTIAELCKKYALDGFEIRMDDDGGICGCKTDDELKNLSETVRNNGLVITDLGSSVCISSYQETVMEAGKRAVDAAQKAGIKAVRVFLGYFAARFNPDKPDPDYAGVVKALKELCEYASKKNVEIWVETHNEFATGKVLKKLLIDVSFANMKIIWDIVHPIEDGETLGETWEYIGSEIAHVHIKDGYDRADREWHDYRYTELGRGALPIAALLDLLEKKNFEGYISFEWESPWREELKGFDNGLDYVLEQYTSYLKKCDENMLPAFTDSGWQKFDSMKTANVPEVSSDGSYVHIFDENPKAALKKIEYTLDVEDKKTYTLSVPYAIKNIKHELMLYGMITFFDADGNWTRRLYLDRPFKERLEKVFKTEGEVKVRVELGLKSFGDIVFYHPMLIKEGTINKRIVKLAAVHLAVIGDIAYADNLKRIEAGFDKAADMGADIICFAETMNDRGTTLKPEEKYETLDGIFCTLMKKKAKERGCYAFFTFHELDADGARHNTAVLLDRNGEIVGTYYKSNLTIGEFESGMVPGNSYPVFDTEFGKVGMLICWDTYFPESARAMTLRGAEILLVSTAGNPTHRHIARAKENGVFVVVACAASQPDAGIAPTKIINPKGEVIAQEAEDNGVAFAEVDINDAKQKDIFWLSVGPANADPNNIYMNEIRPDLFNIILP